MVKHNIRTYSNFHGISNVIGIQFNSGDKMISRHIEMPTEMSVDGVALGLERLADVIRKEVKVDAQLVAEIQSVELLSF